MRQPFKRPLVPLWAIFFTASLLILRFYRNRNLICLETVKEEDTYEEYSRSAARNATLPFHPFEEGQPKLVVILTYQRCGSTFFGQLFNENPDAFYLFEPLDSLYSAIYGTKQGWNVPSDITNYKNGTERTLPQEEIEKVSQFLLTLLMCDVDALPTEALVHRFFRQFSTEFFSISKFVRCINRLESRTSTCTSLAPVQYCGNRFGEKPEEIVNDCSRALTNDTYRSNHVNSLMFDKYLTCMASIRQLADDKCSALWQTACSKRSLRAVKLVRGTMDSMEPLLRALPNLRVIHLIRDPRAVVLSRKKFDSSGRGMFTDLDRNNTLSREAFLYCRTVVRDVSRRKELEAIYPGKIFPVIYDDVVGNIKGYIQDVYEFLGMSVPHEIWSWYRESEYWIRHGTLFDSVTVASKWQDVITVRQNNEIEAACEEFFKTIKYTWVK